MDRVCPLLALAADGRTAIEGVDAGHACHALDDPMPLERSLQAQLCLTDRYPRCERYRQHVAQRGAEPGRSPLAGGLVSTRPLLAPEPAWRGIAGRARRGRSGRVAAIAVGTLAVVGATALLAGPVLSGRLSLLEAVSSESPSPTATLLAATPLPTGRTSPVTTDAAPPTAVPTASPTPTASPSPTPTVAPTPQPTPEPVVTYVVQEGDTLAEIALRFGTTVAALQAANGIEDPNQIIIGQTLIIP